MKFIKMASHRRSSFSNSCQSEMGSVKNWIFSKTSAILSRDSVSFSDKNGMTKNFIPNTPTQESFAGDIDLQTQF